MQTIAFDSLSDVAVASPNDGAVPRWDSGNSQWEDKTEPLEFTQIILLPRSTPVDAATEGGLYYDSDDDSLYVRNASTMVKVGYEADSILKAFMAAKGDIISASANDTPLILSVGTNGHILVPDSGESSGLKWSKNWEMVDGAYVRAYSALGTNLTISGLAVIFTAGEDLDFGEFCYVKSDEKAWKSDADLSTTMPISLMAAATISADASGLFLWDGVARRDAWSWTVGKILYGSTTEALLTETAPSGTGDQVQAVAYSFASNIIRFKPDYTLVEVA